jgi:hypothetical protein
MIGQTLSMILLATGEAPSFGFASPRGHDQESIIHYLQRVKDELLWPRILVRSAPPPDEI